MIVNSINFWFFFLFVLFVYFIIGHKSTKIQNAILLIGSYVFYGIVSWKMCLLLLVSTLFFFFLAFGIAKYNGSNEKRASRLTTLGVLGGVGMLFYFKYLDFFVEQFSSLLASMGLHNNINTFGIIMPLGISFFTFKLMSYVIEVHRETMEPSKDIVAFGTYVAFFPTIMSGPIDQPGKFIPQLDKVRKWDYDRIGDGLKRILWGMFLKMCIADQLSGYTSAVLGHYTHHNTTSLIIAAVLYAFQMYTDFAGYSDMAIGVSKILGLNIAENFNRPIFAQNIAEYWRKWHISLTSWITQYIYMPLNLAFREMGMTGVYLATIINTVAIGAWHGANWTFILFGIYHGFILVFIAAVEKKRKKFEKQHGLKKKSWYKYSRMLLTFILVDIGMVLFQSESVTEFFGILGALGNGFGKPFAEGVSTMLPAIPAIFILLYKEYKDENKLDVHFLHSTNYWVRVVSVAFLISYIILNGALEGGSFIYFQF